MDQEVLPVGTEVTIAASGRSATITAVFLKQNYVQYELAYWGDDQRQTCWAEAHEITAPGNALRQKLVAA